MVDYLAVIVESVAGADPLADTRKRRNVEARVLLANALLMKGYTEAETGDLIGRNHSTINYYKGYLFEVPGMKQKWEKLKKILDI